MATIPSVEVRGLYKHYGTGRVLSGIDLTLHAGQATLLLGDNGAGKSTLLNILGTLIRPSRGTVLYGGRRSDEIDAADLRKALGILGHEPRCYADLSAKENLLFFGRLYGQSKEAARARADELLLRVGLRAAAERPVRTFSRGMVQRLAVARTILSQPSLLLLDEPYTGLDRAGVALLSSLLCEERDRGALLLLTSHDLDAVAQVTDRAIFLRRGAIAKEAHYDRGRCTAQSLAALYAEAVA